MVEEGLSSEAKALELRFASVVDAVVAADRWLAEQGDVQRERQNYAGANYDRAYDQPVGNRGHRVSAPE
jgi:hypothetical protein